MMVQPTRAAAVDFMALIAAEIESSPLDERVKLARDCAAAGDILGWGAAVMPEKFAKPFCQELHGYFVEISKAAFTNTEAPRGHAKTTIKCNLIPMFQALEHPELFRSYLNVQSTEKKGLAVNVAMKLELEQNEVLRELYGDQVGADKWTDQQFVLKNGVVFTAIGAGQSIRGINYRNHRPAYLVVDDLYDDEDINNPESTEKKNDWFWSSLYPARTNTSRASVHVQGTAINKYDLMEQLRGRKGVVSKTFKTILDEEKKLVLWPELKSFEEWIALRSLMPPVIFAREYQNERRDEASAIIKRSWLEGWEYDPVKLRFDRDRSLVEVALKIDPSIGQKLENDFTGMVLMLKTKAPDGPGNEFLIAGAWEAHLSLDERIKLAQRISDARPKNQELTVVKVEAIAGFKDFAAELKRRTNLPVKEIDQVKDKISVLESRSHYFQNGKVKISKDIPLEMREKIIYQLTTNHPKHDDLRDAILLGMDENGNMDWIG